MFIDGRGQNQGVGMVLAESYWSADTSEPVVESTVGGVLRAAAAAAPEGLALTAGVADPGRATPVDVCRAAR